MRNEVKILIGLAAISILLVVGAAAILGGASKPASSTKAADPKLLVKADSNKMGSPTAKVTLVEFGDYECPACGAAYPELKKVTDLYKDQVQFVFRNFPLSQHPNAKISAAAAEAAGKQGKYWQMHDKLYENQLAWGNGADTSKDDAAIAQKVFDGFAKDLGLDLTRFDADMKTKVITDKVDSDENDGIALGVNVTPTFYINGVQYTGVGFNDMKKIIDPLLAKK